MKKLIGMFVVLVSVSGFSEYAAWPSDFAAKMAERESETVPERVVAVQEIAEAPIVLFAGGISGSNAYGSESEPFDSGFMTSEASEGVNFDSSKPVGMVMVLR